MCFAMMVMLFSLRFDRRYAEVNPDTPALGEKKACQRCYLGISKVGGMPVSTYPIITIFGILI